MLQDKLQWACYIYYRIKCIQIEVKIKGKIQLMVITISIKQLLSQVLNTFLIDLIAID